MFKQIIAASLIAASVPSVASALVYDTSPATPGTQQWGGTLGLDFNVNKQVTVTALGSFDSDKNGITHDIYVGIFDLSTGLLVAPAINLNGTTNSGGAAYVTVAVSPLVLGPGSYQLASWGYNLGGGSDANYNNSGPGGPIVFDSLFGALTAVGTRYSDFGSPGILATNPDNGTTRYGAGTFAAYVPEPATWALMIGGFAMTGFAMRRRVALTA